MKYLVAYWSSWVGRGRYTRLCSWCSLPQTGLLTGNQRLDVSVGKQCVLPFLIRNVREVVLQRIFSNFYDYFLRKPSKTCPSLVQYLAENKAKTRSSTKTTVGNVGNDENYTMVRTVHAVFMRLSLKRDSWACSGWTSGVWFSYFTQNVWLSKEIQIAWITRSVEKTGKLNQTSVRRGVIKGLVKYGR